jgi:hypothetical protein
MVKMKKTKKYTFGTWLQEATLAWFRFATAEEVLLSIKDSEIVILIDQVLRSKEGKALAAEMINNPDYKPFRPEQEVKKEVRKYILLFLQALSAKQLRELLKMKSFKDVLRYGAGVPVMNGHQRVPSDYVTGKRSNKNE